MDDVMKYLQAGSHNIDDVLNDFKVQVYNLDNFKNKTIHLKKQLQ